MPGPEAPAAEVQRLFTRGFEHVYSLEYAQAERDFRRIIEIDPDNPAGYSYLATNTWLWELFKRGDLELESFMRTTRFIDDEPPDPKARAKIEQIIHDGIARAEARLKTNPRDSMALFYAGALHGTWGAYEATIVRSGWGSFKAANKGYRYHEKLLQIDPAFYDAYLTTGVFHYVTGSLSLPARVIAYALGFRGDRKRGFQLIETAAAKGRFVDDDARVILAVLYARDNRWDKSLQYLKTQFQKYPRNYLLHIEVANAYDMLGQDDASIRTYQEILALADAGTYRYEEIPRARVHQPLGAVYLKKKEGEKARLHLLQALQDKRIRMEARILATLQLGQAYDLLGQREKAIAQYNQALGMRNYKNSRSLARKYLDKPFDGYRYP